MSDAGVGGRQAPRLCVGARPFMDTRQGLISFPLRHPNNPGARAFKHTAQTHQPPLFTPRTRQFHTIRELPRELLPAQESHPNAPYVSEDRWASARKGAAAARRRPTGTKMAMAIALRSTEEPVGYPRRVLGIWDGQGRAWGRVSLRVTSRSK